MAASSITVAKARDLLYEHVDASDPMDEKFLRQLNQVIERFVDSGLWAKSDFVAELSAPNGYITLPRRAAALLGIRFENQRPRRIFAQAHEFSEVGPGGHEFDQAMSSVYEMPNSPVHTDLTAPSTLTLHVQAGDICAGGEAVLRGLDANGNRLFSPDGQEGTRIMLFAPAANFPVQVSHIESLTLPPHSKYITLKAGDTELGVYEPGETDPSYRRYKVGDLNSDCTVFALCSRKHVDLVSETDLVIPGNIGAIKHGLIGLRLEDASDLDSANAHFEQAYSLLNSELRKLRGKARTVPTFSPGVPALRSFY